MIRLCRMSSCKIRNETNSLWSDSAELQLLHAKWMSLASNNDL